MVSNKYSKAIKEVLHYLKGIREEDVNKIPKTIMNFLEENASKEYICDFDYTTPLKDLSITDEAKGIISFLCYSYWCDTEEEKQEFLNKLNENERLFQEELRKKYNSESFYKNLNNEKNLKETTLQENKSIIIRIFKKIVSLIKNIQKK